MTNADIKTALETIALILDLKGEENPFRVRAYQRAIQTIDGSNYEMKDIYASGGKKALMELPGIGEEIALKIEELLNTGKLGYLEQIRKKIPQGLFDILSVEGIGPKRTKFLWKNFGIKDIEGLKTFALSGKLETLPGWGKKSVEKVLANIGLHGKSAGRLPYKTAKPVAEKMLKKLRASGYCEKVEIAGSLRRKKDTVGDIDFLATSRSAKEVMDFFCAMSEVEHIHSKGPTKSSVFLTIGIDADLRVVDPDVFGAALQYFTGNKDHNVKLRKHALRSGYTLSEYGVYRGTAKTKGKLVASRTEEDVYDILGLSWIPPEQRLDQGEIEAAMKN